MANRRPVVFTVGETELDSAENSVEESILQSEDFREKLELLEAYRREKEMVGVSWINGRSYQIVKPTLRAILAA